MGEAFFVCLTAFACCARVAVFHLLLEVDMARQNCGESFDLILTEDSQILEIDSPKDEVTGGPYKVVYRNVPNRWVIVALDWGTEKKPSLGIRWFYHNHGYPNAFQWGLWFIIPSELSEVILPTLNIDPELHTRVSRFLLGEITGDDLRNS